MRTGPTYSKHFVIEGFESLNTQYQVVNGLRIFDAKTSLKIHQTRLILKNILYWQSCLPKLENTQRKRFFFIIYYLIIKSF